MRAWMTRARAGILAAILLTASCAPPMVTEFHVRDPWQIALETSGGRALLPPGVRVAPRRSEMRDREGFPHALYAGHFEVRGDGGIVVEGVPRVEHGMLRISAGLYDWAPCRGRGWCKRERGTIVFATPWSNVSRIETR